MAGAKAIICRLMALAFQVYGFGYAFAQDASGYPSLIEAKPAGTMSLVTGSNTGLPGYAEGDIPPKAIGGPFVLILEDFVKRASIKSLHKYL